MNPVNPEHSSKETKSLTIDEMTEFIASYGELVLHLSSRIEQCNWGTFTGKVYPHNDTNISSLTWGTKDEVIKEIYRQLKYFEHKIESKELIPEVPISLTANDLYVINKALMCQKSPDDYNFPDKCKWYINGEKGEKLLKRLQRLLQETTAKVIKKHYIGD